MGSFETFWSSVTHLSDKDDSRNGSSEPPVSIWYANQVLKLTDAGKKHYDKTKDNFEDKF
jgi:hypothetical protein